MKKAFLRYLFFWEKKPTSLLDFSLYGILICAIVLIFLDQTSWSDFSVIPKYMILLLGLHIILVNLFADIFLTKKKYSNEYWEGLITLNNEIIYLENRSHHKGERVAVKKPRFNAVGIVVPDVSFISSGCRIQVELMIFYSKINHEEILDKVSNRKPGVFSFEEYLNEKISEHNLDNQKISEYLLEGDSFLKRELILEEINLPELFSFMVRWEFSNLRISPIK